MSQSLLIFTFQLRQSSEAENLFTSVERILEYGVLPPETGPVTTSGDDSENKAEWRVQSGKVEFRNVSLKYGDPDDDYNEDVLSDVSFVVQPGQKVSHFSVETRNLGHDGIRLVRYRVIRTG